MRKKSRSNLLDIFLLIDVLIGLAVPSWFATAKAPINNIVSNPIDKQVSQLENAFRAHSQLLTQLQRQIADNQRDIELLRGQVQENQHQLSQIVNQQHQISNQIDKDNFSSQEATTYKDSQALVRSHSNSRNQAIELDANRTFAVSNHTNGNIDYNKAIVLLLEKRHYNQAINAFHNFVKHYPDSAYQPNANYWLGQINYNQGKKNDALYYFALVAKTYPNSLKAPDALLKVGLILQESGQKDKAKAIYQRVTKLYPIAEAAKQAKKQLTTI